jgi:hypothetical protein
MSDIAITELLKQLHGALENSPSIGDKDRELLKQLSLDIQGLLAKPGEAGSAKHESTVAGLEDAIVRFEVTHPDITGVLAGVSKALADMGI